MDRRRAYAELHTAVILFGFTAILGRLITLEEGVLVWYRMGITTLSLLLFPGLLRRMTALPRRDLLRLAGIGVIVALHWVTFFGSIKASTVSVALSCLGASTLFTAMLEPLLLRRKPHAEEFLLGLLIVPGMYLVHRFTGSYGLGIALGLISAALAALFGTLNKREIARRDALTITLAELGSGWLFLSLALPLWSLRYPPQSWWPAPLDWLWLGLLALLCTTLAYVLTLRALGVLTPFITSLAINLEPVYGILLAMAVFGEHRELSPGFYAGAALVLSAVLIHPWLSARFAARRRAALPPDAS
jgi:drug/metabolite transporter (DMT)-like permease